MQSALWILWNIFLALIPVALATLLVSGIDIWTLRRKRIPWWAWLPLALVWFAFLPNSCYLLTEWRHFVLDPAFTDPRASVPDHRGLIIAAAQSLRFFLYTSVGLLCFTLSIRPIDRLLRRVGMRVGLLGVPFFFLISLGVYLGLIVRLNSWDILNRPLYVADIALQSLTRPWLLKALLILAASLWVLYFIMDIWLDGVQARYFHNSVPGAGEQRPQQE